jgi:hypothetical protein
MNPWPSDAAASASLLRLLVANIDDGGMALGDRLLELFLATAWPNQVAQRQ